MGLAQVAKLREQARHQAAFLLVNKIIWQLQKDRDHKTLASAFGHRSYIYKHLFQLTRNPDLAMLALKDAETQLLLAQSATTLFIVGEMHALNGNYKLATSFYKLDGPSWVRALSSRTKK